MPDLRERTIQLRALDWLEAHYRDRKGIAGVAKRAEARVRGSPQFPRGRADGLLVCATSEGRTLTVSLEAKSLRTHRQVLPDFGCGPVALHGLSAGLVPATGVGYFAWTHSSWLIALALPVVWIAVAILWMGLASRWGRYLYSSVVAQVLRYPGSERWIALGKGQLTRMSEGEQYDLIALCKSKGIGMLLVSPRGIEPRLQPREVSADKADHLQHYACGEELRAQVLGLAE